MTLGFGFTYLLADLSNVVLPTLLPPAGALLLGVHSLCTNNISIQFYGNPSNSYQCWTC